MCLCAPVTPSLYISGTISKHCILSVAQIFTRTPATMMGGRKQQDTASPEHFDRAFKAVNSKLNAENPSGDFHLVPIKLIKAESQVVSGAKYHYEVLVGESESKRAEVKHDELTAENAKPRSGGDRFLYKINVWEQPWKNFVEYHAEKIRDVAADETF